VRCDAATGPRLRADAPAASDFDLALSKYGRSDTTHRAVNRA
jgi:hypothetical protein